MSLRFACCRLHFGIFIPFSTGRANTSYTGAKRKHLYRLCGMEQKFNPGKKQQQLLPHQINQLCQSSPRKITTIDKPIPISQLYQIQEDKNKLLTKNLLLPTWLKEAEEHIQLGVELHCDACMQPADKDKRKHVNHYTEGKAY